MTNKAGSERAETRFGYWEAYWGNDYLMYRHRCSECKEEALTKPETMCDQVLTRYCPYCGADMRGESNAK